VKSQRVVGVSNLQKDNIMFGNGRNKEIIIKLYPRTLASSGMFGTTEVTLEYDRLDIWCDAGHLENLKKVPGVMVANQGSVPVNYGVYIDPRYDTQWVMKEIEAIVQIKPAKKTKKKEEPEVVVGISLDDLMKNYFAGYDSDNEE
jgi:hypothetical protein